MTAKSSSSTSVEALYAHIHRLLDEHVSVHLTTYYVDCTQRRVYEALTGGLLPVPVDDPHSLILPSDPLEDFIQEYCQVEQKDIREKLTAVKEAKELVRYTVKPAPFERTFTNIFSNTFCGYSPNTELLPDPSVLSVRSIRHTPKPGRSKIHRFVLLDLRQILNQNPLGSALEDEDEGVEAQTKDICDARLVVDDLGWKQILSSYQASAFSTARTSETTSALYNKFSCRTPSPPVLAPSPQTPPLFSRMNVTPQRHAHIPASMSDIPLLAPVTFRDSDEDTPEHAAIDDKWVASSTSSPSTPSLYNGTSEQDEIFMPSPESQGHTYELLPAKMDTFNMPRESRVGGSRRPLRVLGQGRLFHEYIGRVIGTTREPDAANTSSASITPLTSVGQAGAFPTPNNMCQSSDDLEGAILGPLTLNFSDEVIDTAILNTSTDIKSGLMDVPYLPAPNVHSRNPVWPNDMSSLVTNEVFSAFYVAKGVKSLNFELTWRPYNSKQEIPTLGELVGVSDVHILTISCVDGEEARAELGALLKSLYPLTHTISIEEEGQRKLQAYLKSPANLHFVTDHLSLLDGGIPNLLLTRAERHESGMFPRSHSETDYGHAGRLNGDDCAARSQGPEQLKPEHPSENDFHDESIDNVQQDSVDLGFLACEPEILSDPIEGLDAEDDIVSARHMQLPTESIISVSSVDLSQNAFSISSLEPSNYSSPDWLHPSKTGGREDNKSLASSGPATCEEQSLRGYLNVLAKQPLSSRVENDMHLTSPRLSEPQRHLTPLFDTEGLVHELSNLSGPLPLEVSPYRNHRYLASVELLQDRPLLRALHLDSLRIQLLEREWLDGADIVFDCNTALVFAPLMQTLSPSSFRLLKDKLSSLSWRYTHLAVIFQLYDASPGLRRAEDGEEPSHLNAHLIKSIKKLHRDLAIAEAYATKRPQTVVQMYFVRSVEQAARTTRLLGDMAESRSQLGPWEDRQWLEMDEKEDERYLAEVDGMNAFAAAVILSQISLHDFLALRADQRLELVLPLPQDMMGRFNELIAQRRDDVDTIVRDDDGSQ